MSHAYRLQWLVEQHTFNAPSLDSLPDAAVACLLRDVEKAAECVREGIPFEDAGLVRSLEDDLPEPW